LFRILRALLRQPATPSEGARVREITTDNRVVFDVDSILDSPAAREHIAAVREHRIGVPTHSAVTNPATATPVK
jgi:hypothetical protein